MKTAVTYEATLARLCQDDERVVVLTAENRAAIRGLPALLGDRFVDVGICEQTMVGMAAGFALRGRIPVVHALATFLTLRAFEFIRSDVGIGHLPVKLIGGVAGLLSEANGPTHQALDDLAVMRAIPGMSIVCPADEGELCAALPSVLAAPGPVYVRHNARPGGDIVHQPFVLGRAERLTQGQGEGDDIQVLALGFLVPEALEAAGLLASDGLSVGVTNMRSLVPIDEEAIVAAARAARLLVTVEDHFLVGGLYQTVSEILVRRGLAGVRVHPIGFDGRFFAPGLLADVMQHEGMTAAGLAGRIESAWARMHTVAPAAQSGSLANTVTAFSAVQPFPGGPSLA
ncbi:MAG: transketolase [Deltaproteobacteria bacterium]|nr:transketolase [Deltaproteobacteria bacterium]